MSSPDIILKKFPYRRKWTTTQVEEIKARELRIADAMMDAVGPDGQVLGIPSDIIHIMALHLTLAGADIRDELAYIVAVIRNSNGLPADFHQWVIKDEYEPAPPDPDETRRKATAAADQIRRQLSPEVRREVMAMMRDEFTRTTEDKDGAP